MLINAATFLRRWMCCWPNSDPLILLLDDVKDKVENSNVEKTVQASPTSSDSSPPLYFRKVTFVNPVPIRLDYHSKGNFEWKHGPIAALIIGIASLNYVEFTLKRLENNHGILGFDKLIQYFAQEWKNDIKRNQIHTVLSGVGPIHSLVQLFQGVRDLIWLPIEQYQKDGRIVRGLQRGANSFTTSTAMAALELTNRFINLIQLTAETAYDMMSPGPSVRRAIAIKAKGRKKRYNQPQDIREGVANAYNVVKEGFGETAENIVRVASIEKEQKGITGAVGGVLRQIPTAMIKPIIIASEATSNVLGGMQCQLLPDAKREANEKWKNDGDM